MKTKTVIRLCVILLGTCFLIIDSFQCTSNYKTTVEPCFQSYISTNSFLMNFRSFQLSEASECHCRIFIRKGSRFFFNYLSSPGYYGCGTQIRLTHQYTSLFRCVPAADSFPVIPGDIVSVVIAKEGTASHINSEYCYSIYTVDETNSSKEDGSVAVTCDKPATTTSAVTSTLPTMSSSELQTTLADGEMSTSHEMSFANTSEYALPTNFFTTNGIKVTPITLKTVYLPWEIITPVSLLLMVLAVAVVVLVKIRKGRRQKLRMKKSIMGTMKQRCKTETVECKRMPSPLCQHRNRTSQKTMSAEYSVVNEHVNTRTSADGIANVPEEQEMTENKCSGTPVAEKICSGGDARTGLSSEEKETLCANMDMLEKFIEETTQLALQRFYGNDNEGFVSEEIKPIHDQMENNKAIKLGEQSIEDHVDENKQKDVLEASSKDDGTNDNNTDQEQPDGKYLRRRRFTSVKSISLNPDCFSTIITDDNMEVSEKGSPTDVSDGDKTVQVFSDSSESNGHGADDKQLRYGENENKSRDMDDERNNTIHQESESSECGNNETVSPTLEHNTMTNADSGVIIDVLARI